MKWLAYLLCSAFLSLFAADARAVTIPTVPVGNPGNAGELSGTTAGPVGIVGAVNYAYRIGTTEVTNAQYAEFLNAKAASDPLELYTTSMDSDARGGITRSGSSPNFSYAVKTNMGNKPVNCVSWYDSIRFANWLNNGQGTGDTETGAYTILGGTANPSNGWSITRNVGATWFLTSEDEWYKAAYHQPAAQGGDSDDYWLYATASNSQPTFATANSVGNISNPGTNVANFFGVANWNGTYDGNVTTVGSAGPLSDSFYGTADQVGNVWEWNEALILFPSNPPFRGLRGCSFGNFLLGSRSTDRFAGEPFFGKNDDVFLGFRVATVPEPSTLVLATLGILALVGLRRGRRSIGSAVVLLALALFAADSRAVTIPTVPVGNAGNLLDDTGYGAVAYGYNIGTTEVTVGQYTAFLNAVAATDTYALYRASMATDLNIAGISRTGASGSYAYSVIGSANKPVTYVSWGDAARFSNWLHNGQPTGAQDASTTEDGAYPLNGATTDAALNAVSRNPGAVWFLPSQHEWYKAAYHKNDGATGNYWDYPTSTDSAPYSDQPPGSDAPTQSNTANFRKNDSVANGYDDGFAVTGSTGLFPNQYYLTDAGAYALSTSPYGTYDQGGNVHEWNEALIIGSFRGLRGGAFGFLYAASALRSSVRDYGRPSIEISEFGFRVATVPEPSTFALAAMGILGVLACARRRRSCLRS